MKGRSRGILLISLLVLTLAVAFALISRRPHLAKQSLSDGTILTLVALKTGDQHFFPLSGPVEKLAALLPAKLQNWLRISPPPRVTAYGSTSNYMSIWIIQENTNGLPRKPLRILVADDQDNFGLTDDNSYSRNVSGLLSSNIYFDGLALLSWPRRAETLRLQVYLESDTRLLSEFRVPNPAPAKIPPWTAEPWPVTVQDGDLEFTLTSLWLKVGWDARTWKLRSDKRPFQTYNRATFQVTKGGELQTNWTVRYIRHIRDATGNWSHGGGFNFTNRAGEIFNQFDGPELPDGEAWRIIAEFSRTSGFGPHELHTVTNVPLPEAAPNQRVTSVPAGTNLLELRIDQRPSKTYPVHFWAEVKPSASSFPLHSSQSDCRLTLVRATDDLGRDVPFNNAGGGPNVTAEELTVAEDASSLNLVFGYEPIRPITFQVKPEVYRPPQRVSGLAPTARD